MVGRSSTPEEAFGVVLRRVRHQRGLSQEALAEATDRHRTYVSLVERGRNSPSLRTLFRLASALEVHPSELIRAVELELRD